ncbi:MAG: MaoC family dehydratase [Ferrovibrio sp.]|jgi:acyl dehydratase|uniref:MaoC family dehydratase n=1 Tax=Ferrovibrio sp. TaxID=1917215 RepID=UPI00391B111D
MPSISHDRALTQAEFDLFAKVSGDNNPIHVDPDFSARTRFGRTVSHGMLLYTVLWGLLQQRHPGARQINHSMMFPNPAYAGEALRFVLDEIASGEGRRSYAAKVTRIADGAVVLDGQTEIALP